MSSYDLDVTSQLHPGRYHSMYVMLIRLILKSERLTGRNIHTCVIYHRSDSWMTSVQTSGVAGTHRDSHPVMHYFTWSAILNVQRQIYDIL